jgi:predicted DNA-binding helix-hairpin-helix protein
MMSELFAMFWDKINRRKKKKAFMWVHQKPVLSKTMGHLLRNGAVYKDDWIYEFNDDEHRAELGIYLEENNIKYSLIDEGQEFPALSEKEARYLARGNAFERVL